MLSNPENMYIYIYNIYMYVNISHLVLQVIKFSTFEVDGIGFPFTIKRYVLT